MQDSGRRNPSSQERIKSIPTDASALTAADQYIPPQPGHTPTKDAQLSRVAWNSMVLVVALHNRPKPRTDFEGTVMLPALKFSLNGL